MTDNHSDNSPAKLNSDEARAGRPVKGMTTVLGVSMVAVILIGIAISACSGTPPTHLGIINGQLAKCPDSPNCVSSFDDQNDSVHYIEPIRFTSANSPRKNLEKAIISIAGVTVIESKPNYIYAEFQSRLMKYVDDVEFYKQLDLPAEAREIPQQSGVLDEECLAVFKEWQKMNGILY